MQRRGLLSRAYQLVAAALAAWVMPSRAQQSATDKGAASAQVKGAVAKGKTGIHPWFDKGTVLQLEFLADGAVLGKLDYTESVGHMQRMPALTFQWPVDGKKLQLRGTIKPPTGSAQKINRSWTVLDIGPYTAKLYDESLPIDERILSLVPEFEKLKQKAPGLVDYEPAQLISVEPNSADSFKALDALEKKMKLILPAQVRTVLRKHIQIEDSYFLKPKDVKSAAAMIVEWGGSLSDMKPALRARYERSVALYVEVGDGMGMLCWDPQGVVAGESSNGSVDKDKDGAKPGNPADGVWFWMHQESLYKPRMILDANMQPVGANKALISPAQRFGLGSLDFGAQGGYLVLDGSNPLFHLQLSSGNGNEPVTLMVRSYESTNHFLGVNP